MDDKKRLLSPSDKRDLVKDAEGILGRNLGQSSRRGFLRQGLTFGGLLLLSGCKVDDDADVENLLSRISRFNDQVQGKIFSGSVLAPEYKDSEITRPFPFNAFYGEDEIRQVDGDSYRLAVRGLVRDTRDWQLSQLYRMAQVTQITRHICVEGWSAIGKWGGIPFRDFLHLVGADKRAQYVSFKCADDYYTSIDMATALHPQTLLALTWDGQVLPPEYGYPMKLRMPTKLGYKNPKHIVAIEVTNTYPGGYWEDQGYNWFGGS